MSLLFHTMNDYQFGRYQQQYSETSFEKGAVWALGLTAPAMTSSFGPVSFYNSPLIQSLKTARPYGRYSDGPAEQYMLGDGSVFTGTPSALAQFKQQRAAQTDMVYMDRLPARPSAESLWALRTAWAQVQPRRTSSMALAARPMGWSWPTGASEARSFQATTTRPA